MKIQILFVALVFAALPASASRVVDVSPLTSSVVMLHLLDGRARHETLGNGFDGSVSPEPLDLRIAAAPASYSLESADDADFKAASHPAGVGRKSRGREFVKNGGKFEWVPEHWIFLRLSKPMKPGKSYRLNFADGLVSGQQTWSWRFDDRVQRSDAVHVNQVGFRPDATKFAYVSSWMGDAGPLSFDDFAGAPFRVLDSKTGEEAFAGRLEIRHRLADGAESGRTDSPSETAPFAGADVWQCDFSALRKAGRYVVSLAGVGCSFPFDVGADVYRAPSQTVLHAMYQQRCHTALDAKFTDFPRAACHTAEQTKFLQTNVRALDRQYHDGKQNDKVETTGENRVVTFGWHDAGDWDHEAWHSEAVETLLLAYQAAPRKWADDNTRIPESGNGIPDLLDEAMWGANLYKQLQRPDGGTSAGTFADWWPRDGQTSTTDTMTYYIYAPDPKATFRYAAIGAQLSYLLPGDKKKLADEYLRSAVAAWDWAAQNLRDGDEAKVRDDRCQAGAALFQATGDEKYLAAFKNDFRIKIGDPLTIYDQFDLRWAAWVYAFCDRPNRDVELQKTVVTLIRNYTDVEFLQTAQKRAFRKGVNWWKDLGYGAASNPDGLALMMSHALSHDPKYLLALSNNCDLTLGGNPLNMSWITGVGARSPHEILRIEDWYSPRQNRDAPLEPVPGILVFGPQAFAGDLAPGAASGPWDVKWNQATTYPNGAKWPGYELYIEDRFLASENEFTISDLAVAAVSLGYLRAG